MRDQSVPGARAIALVLAIALVPALGACGGDKEVELVEGVTVDVQALDNRFVPAEVSVKPGTYLHWNNDGRNDHNVLPAEEGAFEAVETEVFGPGDEATVRFTEPGTYPYYCSIHGTDKVGMLGTVVVEA